MQHRNDIDGLRFFAVIPIFLFHLGLTKYFGGGYTGVDIFFVISGFLITSIIYQPILQKTRYISKKRGGGGGIKNKH
jgi:peptidoglycan/LPS O-acetylase OafA/YrhL